ncbi:protein jag [Faecalicatena sp. AGMB00832]|uniref:RNA-binding protein KhpB n=1 Tax=Faecalicatena faecalis TaxID=2726362 RepID=A0ABS6D4P8_9FIRM|nr:MULTISPECIES: RNA-binding cell elongation regulator Jag/EloR [Faecalicatena]MBU3876557.1 protein jag [Faecalicatena faecalis]MCI6466816.1 protein jag [Faecalicatena sp.]MCI7181999.1 protein jag [Lachnospiraceae bacterium]MDY5619151.1 RNA-binding cell elongation regulator Jag/EloR [Lachnospiraceae bacterium]
MNGSIRVSAKTVDDAITEALIQLGVTSDRLDYEVIEKGSAGFLGIGVKQAVIEARRKPEPVVEEPEIKAEVKTEVKAEAKPVEKKAPVKEVKKKEHVKKDEHVKREVKEEAHKDEVQPSVKRESELAEVKDETKKAVESFLNDTLKAMGMTVELISNIDADGALSVEMKGDNMGILIGKRGQTLDSLQYLANRVANKHQDGYVRVKLDTENYRARREETLKNLAKNIAYKVKRSKRAVSLEPMNPYERRIIHAALQSDPFVTTHSEGDEPYRKVVVTLKK